MVRKSQARLLEMAIIVRNILEKAKIPYFITYGTLLGAIRHKGFIPWDDDFDFYLFDDSYDAALDALRKNLPEDMFLEWYDSEPNYFHAWARVKDLKTECDNVLSPQDMAYKHRGLNVDLYKAKLMKRSEEKVYQAEQHLAYLDRRKKLGLISDTDYIYRKSKLDPILSNKGNDNSLINGEEMIYAFMTSKNGFHITPEELFPMKRYSFENELFYGPKDADTYLRRFYGDYMKLPAEKERVPHNKSVKFKK